MLDTLVILLVFAALSLVFAGLIYALAPKFWSQVSLSGVGDVAGDVRRAAGRWDLVHIERMVLRKVTSRAQITLERAFLPNRIVVKLAPTDMDRLTALLPAMQDDLVSRLRSLAGKPVQRDPKIRYEQLGRIVVHIVGDQMIRPGNAQVETGFAIDTTLAGGSPDQRPTPDIATQTRWKIHVAGITHDVVHTMTVGRGRGSDIRLDDPRVSALHARLILIRDQLYVEDAQSTNGTGVNGRPISTRCALESGDLVSFGGIPAGRVVHDKPTVRATS